MASIQNKNVRIQVNVCEETEHGKFQSAIYFTPDEFLSKTEQEISDLTKNHVENWVHAVSDSKIVSTQEVSVETLQEEKANLEQQKQDLQNKIQEIESKIISQSV
jgi:predicted transcriptional regulator